jgi:hypothetical protein
VQETNAVTVGIILENKLAECSGDRKSSLGYTTDDVEFAGKLVDCM